MAEEYKENYEPEVSEAPQQEAPASQQPYDGQGQSYAQGPVPGTEQHQGQQYHQGQYQGQASYQAPYQDQYQGQAPYQGQYQGQGQAPYQGNPQYQGQSPYAPQQSFVAVGNPVNKIVYALLALFLGGLGAHKFYGGRTGAGILYLLFCWTLIPGIIGFIEGLVALAKPTDQFGNIYV